MIVVKNIHKSFGSLEVLKGVDLTVGKAEILSIIGKSGAGKTTLLQIIGTLDKPDSGNVIIDGVDVFDMKENELSDFRNRHIGFIFQFHQLLPEFNALENVMMSALIARIPEKDAEKRAIQLLTELGMAPYVASLTTINTPHRGCLYADRLLERVSSNIQSKVALAYNSVFHRLGDHNPDFLAAARDLTATGCQRFEEMPAPDGVYCQSVGSVLERAWRGTFPMNATYWYVRRFDGPNDGLVAESAFAWGEKYTLVTTKSHRGISHTDMMDLNRENLPDFDVREFYVQLVADLKNRGL